MDSKNIYTVERSSGRLQKETVFGGGSLRFIYDTLLGRSLWGFFFNTSCLSSLLGRYYDSRRSRKNICKLAALPGCSPQEAEFPQDTYESFNSFFVRRLKKGARPFDAAKDILSSPADGRIMVWQELMPEDAVPVKGAERTLNDLCCGRLPAGETLAAAVIRLAPVDYHRYHFPCSCRQDGEPLVVRGKYHSVNPVALAKRPDIYVENTRQITELVSDEFGTFFFVEVGAFGVGSIIQTAKPGEHFRQEEKGYFKFGGSTVILIFSAGRLKWHDDLLANSAKGYETLIRCGEGIGMIPEQTYNH